jgi:magnesium chelatase accessory protein
MMANWNLWPLLHDLPRLATPLTLVAPDRDRAVPPRVATRAASLVRQGSVIPVTGRGHLAHEEDPTAFAAIIGKACA